jgi:peptide subunit release factor 1 (eRF1)
MISLIIPPKDQISRVSKMLADEFGTASNIKSRVNRLSVLGAITSVQHRLKLYTKGMYQMLAPCEPVTKCKGFVHHILYGLHMRHLIPHTIAH